MPLFSRSMPTVAQRLASPTPIETGMQDLNVSVTVVYELT